MAKRKTPLHVQILIGLAAGLVTGLLVNSFSGPLQSVIGTEGTLASLASFVVATNDFVGDLFLRGLQFIAVPIVLFSLVAGVGSLNDLSKLSRIGGKTVAIYTCTTAIAISAGLLFANLTQPGTWLPQDLRDSLATEGAGAASDKIAGAVAPDFASTLLNIVPKNPFAALASGNMLQVVFLAVFLGVCLSMIQEEKAKSILHLSEALTDVVVKMVQVLMKMAPFAVFCLIAGVMAQLGLHALGALLVYALTVLAGLGFMTFIVYPTILRLVAGMGFKRFFNAIAPAQLLAFSSSSSGATLPVTMECVEKRVGVREEVSRFVLPLGATINMDGTALYQGVAALFIAQLYGIPLDFSDQLTIVATATLASIGTAGVPGVGIIMLVVVLQSVDIPTHAMQGGIAIIFGVDRFLDMCRTVTNITGDAMVATVIASTEDALDDEATVKARLDEEEDEGLDETPGHQKLG